MTNAALERFIVTEMGFFVTVESLGVCCREEIRLLAIRCPRLGALQVVLEGVSVDNSTKLLSCPRLYGLESILDGVSVEDELQELQSGTSIRSFNRELNEVQLCNELYLRNNVHDIKLNKSCQSNHIIDQISNM